MGKIFLQNIKVFAYHGCVGAEEKIGSFYEINLKLDTDFSKVSNTDDIEDTVNYVTLNRIIREQMKIISKTLEHVSRRILDKIGTTFPEIKHAELSVSKINPPVEGEMEKFTVIVEQVY